MLSFFFAPFREGVFMLTSPEKESICKARYFAGTGWGKMTPDGPVYSPEAELAIHRGATFVTDFAGLYMWPRDDGNHQKDGPPVSWSIATKARMQLVNECGFKGHHAWNMYDKALRLDRSYFVQKNFGENPGGEKV